MSKNVLIIVDPQNDFISGSLAVKDADKVMDGLVSKLRRNKREYTSIIITMDSHPKDHISFESQGGQWPEHCVMLTEGWNMYPPLEEYKRENPDQIVINTVYKGTDPQREEYSAVDNDMNKDIVNGICGDADRIDVCGIMSEYCVLDTVKGLCDMKPTDGNKPYGERINILFDYTATADNHKKLIDFVVQKKILCSGTSCC